jgi:NAD(P)-dependent dehydrogenase (short-subunit alcohol dehydrogenase family)
MIPETLSLVGKVAVVTGSGRESGIGAGIATALARNGASVVLNYLSDTTGPRAAALAAKIEAEYGVKVVPIQADVEDPEGANSLVEKTLEVLEADHIDILSRLFIFP